MIIGISIIVIIIVKEVFFSSKKNRISSTDPLPIAAVEGDKVESIYLHGTKVYLVLETEGENKEVRVIDLEDGMELLKRLRASNDVPVIFLTSKDDEIDEAIGLRMGADDYITKPFSQKLLIERIRAVLRRTLFKNSDSSDKMIQRNELSLDPDRHLCKWKGQEIRLTVTEFLILYTLALRPGLVKNRDQLIDTAYGETIYVDDRTIDSHIKRMRRKFRVFDKDFDCIETLYGVGYRYRDV